MLNLFENDILYVIKVILYNICVFVLLEGKFCFIKFKYLLCYVLIYVYGLKLVIIFFQVLKYLYDYNFVYMDIKLDNIFIFFDDICKFGDFGLVLDFIKV